MFRSAVSKISLRRCLHTSATRSVPVWRPGRIGMVLGATAAVGYLSWKNETIALDAVSSSPSKRDTSQSPRSPESTKASSLPAAAPTDPIEPSIHEKHDASPAHDTFASEVGNNHNPLPSSDRSLASGSDVEAVSRRRGGGEGEEGNDAAAAAAGDDHGDDAGGGGAYNPVTGEINWDCPCLGGMAHGPCGMQFREAFSCFVYSEQDPKGIDCVEKFKAMQNCFREHPDVYGDEIMNDDDEEEGLEALAPVSGALDTPSQSSGTTLQSETAAMAMAASAEPPTKQQQQQEPALKKKVPAKETSIA